MTKLCMILIGVLALHTSSAFADGLHVDIHGARNFSSTEASKLAAAKKLIETVINSPEFRVQVLNFTYNGQKAFIQNNGLTNQQVYEYMMTGAEQYPKQTQADEAMDFDLELYTSSWFGRGTLGYTDQNTETIHMNTRFYDSAPVNEIAMNLTHEWLHKMGFDHDSNRTARRPYSVPYAIGYLVRDLGAKLIAQHPQLF